MAEPVLEEDVNVEDQLSPCGICGRTFLPGPLQKHNKICEKNATKKRKVFNSLKQRVEGTDLAPFHQQTYLRKPEPACLVRSKSPPKVLSTTWKEKHQELVSAIREAKETTTELSRMTPNRQRSLSLPNAGFERCPSCDRQFGPKAFDRHVEWCKEKRCRVAASPAGVQQAKERLEARIKYRVPPMNRPKKTVKEKYQCPGKTEAVKSTCSLNRAPSMRRASEKIERASPSRDKLEPILKGDGKGQLGHGHGHQQQQKVERSAEVKHRRAEPMKSSGRRLPPQSKLNPPEVNCLSLDLTVSSLCGRKLVTWSDLALGAKKNHSDVSVPSSKVRLPPVPVRLGKQGEGGGKAAKAAIVKGNVRQNLLDGVNARKNKSDEATLKEDGTLRRLSGKLDDMQKSKHKQGIAAMSKIDEVSDDSSEATLKREATLVKAQKSENDSKALPKTNEVSHVSSEATLRRLSDKPSRKTDEASDTFRKMSVRQREILRKRNLLNAKSKKVAEAQVLKLVDVGDVSSEAMDLSNGTNEAGTTNSIQTQTSRPQLTCLAQRRVRSANARLMEVLTTKWDEVTSVTRLRTQGVPTEIPTSLDKYITEPHKMSQTQKLTPRNDDTSYTQEVAQLNKMRHTQAEVERLTKESFQQQCSRDIQKGQNEGFKVKRDHERYRSSPRSKPGTTRLKKGVTSSAEGNREDSPQSRRKSPPLLRIKKSRNFIGVTSPKSASPKSTKKSKSKKKLKKQKLIELPHCSKDSPRFIEATSDSCSKDLDLIFAEAKRCKSTGVENSSSIETAVSRYVKSASRDDDEGRGAASKLQYIRYPQEQSLTELKELTAGNVKVFSAKHYSDDDDDDDTGEKNVKAIEQNYSTDHHFLSHSSLSDDAPKDKSLSDNSTNRNFLYLTHGHNSLGYNDDSLSRSSSNDNSSSRILSNDDCPSHISLSNDDSPSHIVLSNDDSLSHISLHNDDSRSRISLRNDDFLGHISLRNDDSQSRISLRNDDSTGHISLRNDDSLGHISLSNDNSPRDISLRNDDSQSHISLRNDDSQNHISLRNDNSLSHIPLRNDDSLGHIYLNHCASSLDQDSTNHNQNTHDSDEANSCKENRSSPTFTKSLNDPEQTPDNRQVSSDSAPKTSAEKPLPKTNSEGTIPPKNPSTLPEAVSVNIGDCAVRREPKVLTKCAVEARSTARAAEDYEDFNEKDEMTFVINGVFVKQSFSSDNFAVMKLKDDSSNTSSLVSGNMMYLAPSARNVVMKRGSKSVPVEGEIIVLVKKMDMEGRGDSAGVVVTAPLMTEGSKRAVEPVEGADKSTKHTQRSNAQGEKASTSNNKTPRAAATPTEDLSSCYDNMTNEAKSELSDDYQGDVSDQLSDKALQEDDIYNIPLYTDQVAGDSDDENLSEVPSLGSSSDAQGTKVPENSLAEGTSRSAPCITGSVDLIPEKLTEYLIVSRETVLYSNSGALRDVESFHGFYPDAYSSTLSKARLECELRNCVSDINVTDTDEAQHTSYSESDLVQFNRLQTLIRTEYMLRDELLQKAGDEFIEECRCSSEESSDACNDLPAQIYENCLQANIQRIRQLKCRHPNHPVSIHPGPLVVRTPIVNVIQEESSGCTMTSMTGAHSARSEDNFISVLREVLNDDADPDDVLKVTLKQARKMLQMETDKAKELLRISIRDVFSEVVVEDAVSEAEVGRVEKRTSSASSTENEDATKEAGEAVLKPAVAIIPEELEASDEVSAVAMIAKELEANEEVLKQPAVPLSTEELEANAGVSKEESMSKSTEENDSNEEVAKKEAMPKSTKKKDARNELQDEVQYEGSKSQDAEISIGYASDSEEGVVIETVTEVFLKNTKVASPCAKRELQCCRCHDVAGIKEPCKEMSVLENDADGRKMIPKEVTAASQEHDAALKALIASQEREAASKAHKSASPEHKFALQDPNKASKDSKISTASSNDSISASIQRNSKIPIASKARKASSNDSEASSLSKCSRTASKQRKAGAKMGTASTASSMDSQASSKQFKTASKKHRTTKTLESDNASSTERKASPKERKASPKERKASPKERKASAKERKASSKERKASAKERKASSKERKASSKERKASSKERKASAKERKSSSKERKASTKVRNVSSKERNDSSKERNGGSKRRKSSSRSSRVSTKDSIASRNSRTPSRDNRASLKENTDASTNQRTVSKGSRSSSASKGGRNSRASRASTASPKAASKNAQEKTSEETNATNAEEEAKMPRPTEEILTESGIQEAKGIKVKLELIWDKFERKLPGGTQRKSEKRNVTLTVDTFHSEIPVSEAFKEAVSIGSEEEMGEREKLLEDRNDDEKVLKEEFIREEPEGDKTGEKIQRREENDETPKMSVNEVGDEFLICKPEAAKCMNRRIKQCKFEEAIKWFGKTGLEKDEITELEAEFEEREPREDELEAQPEDWVITRALKEAERVSRQVERAAKDAERASKDAQRASKEAEEASKQTEEASKEAERASKQTEEASKEAEEASVKIAWESKDAEWTPKDTERTSKEAERTSKDAERMTEQTEQAGSVQTDSIGIFEDTEKCSMDLESTFNEEEPSEVTFFKRAVEQEQHSANRIQEGSKETDCVGRIRKEGSVGIIEETLKQEEICGRIEETLEQKRDSMGTIDKESNEMDIIEEASKEESDSIGKVEETLTQKKEIPGRIEEGLKQETCSKSTFASSEEDVCTEADTKESDESFYRFECNELEYGRPRNEETGQRGSKLDQLTQVAMNNKEEDEGKVDKEKVVCKTGLNIDKMKLEVYGALVEVDEAEAKLGVMEVMADETGAKVDKMDVRGDKTDVRVDETDVRVDKTDVRVDIMEVKVDKIDVKAYKMDEVDKTCAKVNKTCANVDKTCAKVDKPCEKVDKTCAKVDKTCAKVDKPCEKVDKTCAKVDKTCANVDKTCAKVDKTCAKVNKTGGKVDKMDVRVDKTDVRVDITDAKFYKMGGEVDNTSAEVYKMNEVDKTCTKVDKMDVRVNKTVVRVDKTDVRVDQTDVRVDKMDGKVDKTCAKVDKPCEKVGKTCAKVDKTCAKVGKPYEKVDKTCAKVDKTCEKVDKTCAKVDKPCQVGKMDVRVDIAEVKVDKVDVKVDKTCPKVYKTCEKVDKTCAKVDKTCPKVDKMDVRVDITDVRVDITDVRVDITDVRVDITDVRVDITEVRVDLTDVIVDITDAKVDKTDVRVDLTDVIVDTTNANDNKSNIKSDTASLKDRSIESELNKEKQETTSKESEELTTQHQPGSSKTSKEVSETENPVVSTVICPENYPEECKEKEEAKSSKSRFKKRPKESPRVKKTCEEERDERIQMRIEEWRQKAKRRKELKLVSEAKIVQKITLERAKGDKSRAKSEHILKGGLKDGGKLEDNVKAGENRKEDVKAGENRKEDVKAGENRKDYVKAGENRKDYVKTGESRKEDVKAGENRKEEVKAVENRKDYVKAGENRKDYVKTGDSRKEDVKAGENRKEEVKAVENRKDYVKAGENRKDYVKTGEKRKEDVITGENQKEDVKAGESRKEGVKAGENRKDVVKTGENRKDYVKTGENRKDVVKTGENRKDVVKAGENRMEYVKAGENRKENVKAFENRKDYVKAGENRKDDVKADKNQKKEVKDNKIAKEEESPKQQKAQKSPETSQKSEDKVMTTIFKVDWTAFFESDQNEELCLCPEMLKKLKGKKMLMETVYKEQAEERAKIRSAQGRTVEEEVGKDERSAKEKTGENVTNEDECQEDARSAKERKGENLLNEVEGQKDARSAKEKTGENITNEDEGQKDARSAKEKKGENVWNEDEGQKDARSAIEQKGEILSNEDEGPKDIGSLEVNEGSACDEENGIYGAPVPEKKAGAYEDDLRSVGKEATSVGNEDTSVGNEDTSVGTEATSVGNEATTVGNEDTSVGTEATSIGKEATTVGKEATSVGNEATSVGNEDTSVGTETTSIGKEATSVGNEAISVGNEDTSVGTETTSIGKEATSVGNEAISVGNEDTSVGTETTSIGKEATSVGNEATTVGNEDTSVGTEATSIGKEATTVGKEATSIGKEATSIGKEATSVGKEATSVGNEATTIGNEDTSVGTEATSIGKEATSIGQVATSIGKEATSIGKEATSVGKEATSDGTEATSVGKEATSIGKEATIVEKEATLVDKEATSAEEDTTSVGKTRISASNDATDTTSAIKDRSASNDSTGKKPKRSVKVSKVDIVCDDTGVCRREFGNKRRIDNKDTRTSVEFAPKILESKDNFQTPKKPSIFKAILEPTTSPQEVIKEFASKEVQVDNLSTKGETTDCCSCKVGRTTERCSRLKEEEKVIEEVKSFDRESWSRYEEFFCYDPPRGNLAKTCRAMQRGTLKELPEEIEGKRAWQGEMVGSEAKGGRIDPALEEDAQKKATEKIVQEDTTQKDTQAQNDAWDKGTESETPAGKIAKHWRSIIRKDIQRSPDKMTPPKSAAKELVEIIERKKLLEKMPKKSDSLEVKEISTMEKVAKISAAKLKPNEVVAEKITVADKKEMLDEANKESAERVPDKNIPSPNKITTNSKTGSNQDSQETESTITIQKSTNLIHDSLELLYNRKKSAESLIKKTNSTTDNLDKPVMKQSGNEAPIVHPDDEFLPKSTRSLGLSAMNLIIERSSSIKETSMRESLLDDLCFKSAMSKGKQRNINPLHASFKEETDTFIINESSSDSRSILVNAVPNHTSSMQVQTSIGKKDDSSSSIDSRSLKMSMDKSNRPSLEASSSIIGNVVYAPPDNHFNISLPRSESESSLDTRSFVLAFDAKRVTSSVGSNGHIAKAKKKSPYEINPYGKLEPAISSTTLIKYFNAKDDVESGYTVAAEISTPDISKPSGASIANFFNLKELKKQHEQTPSMIVQTSRTDLNELRVITPSMQVVTSLEENSSEIKETDISTESIAQLLDVKKMTAETLTPSKMEESSICADKLILSDESVAYLMRLKEIADANKKLYAAELQGKQLASDETTKASDKTIKSPSMQVNTSQMKMSLWSLLDQNHQDKIIPKQSEMNEAFPPEIIKNQKSSVFDQAKSASDSESESEEWHGRKSVSPPSNDFEPNGSHSGGFSVYSKNKTKIECKCTTVTYCDDQIKCPLTPAQDSKHVVVVSDTEPDEPPVGEIKNYDHDKAYLTLQVSGSSILKKRAIEGDEVSVTKSELSVRFAQDERGSTDTYNPFITAERQLMELLECDDFKSLKKTPSPLHYSFNSTPIKTRDRVVQQNNAKNRASVIDPPNDFRDSDIFEDNFELIENFINANLNDENLLDKLDSLSLGSSKAHNDNADDLNIDPRLINEYDNLSIPEHLINTDDEGLPQIKFFTPQASAVGGDRLRQRAKTTTKVAAKTSPPATSSSSFPRSASPMDKKKPSQSLRKSITPVLDPVKPKNMKNKEDVQNYFQEQEALQKPQAKTKEDMVVEDLFSIDDEVYEDYKKYEQMYLKEKEEKLRQQEKRGQNEEESTTPKVNADSAYGSLSRGKAKVRTKVAKLIPLEHPTDSASSSGSETAQPVLTPAITQTQTISRIMDKSNGKRGKFCHECGNKYPVNTAKFCVECGVKRLPADR